MINYIGVVQNAQSPNVDVSGPGPWVSTWSFPVPVRSPIFLFSPVSNLWWPHNSIYWKLIINNFYYLFVCSRYFFNSSEHVGIHEIYYGNTFIFFCENKEKLLYYTMSNTFDLFVCYFQNFLFPRKIAWK